LSPGPRFVADAMLGSLARKLRIFGYDTLYFNEGEDGELEELAARERRVLLTADKALFAHARSRGIRGVLVEGKTDRARLTSVSRGAGQLPSSHAKPAASRCAVCNGELDVIKKRDAASIGVPTKVIERHRIFYRCASCSKTYWRGRHWERLRRLPR
jgi:uncharacterized protein